MKPRKGAIPMAGAGEKHTIADWLTPEGISPLTAAILRKLIVDASEEDFASSFDGASKDDVRKFLEEWELCYMPYWSANEVARAIAISDAGRSEPIALKAVQLAMDAGELPQHFLPRQGIEWAMARGYLMAGKICKLVGASPGTYGHPHNALPHEQAECSKQNSKPMPRQRSQEEEILRVIIALKYRAKALPKNKKPGIAGVKAEVRKNLPFPTTVFDKAWERLLKDDRIQYEA